MKTDVQTTALSRERCLSTASGARYLGMLPKFVLGHQQKAMSRLVPMPGATKSEQGLTHLSLIQIVQSIVMLIQVKHQLRTQNSTSQLQCEYSN